MSQFVVSARKFRPLRFDDVVGQSHVGQTLKNAIRQDTLAHAFLFCGPRGVGKTTCARILAKVLNCKHVTEDTEPCGKCESCIAFDRNASLNILELDAASNNSVEHIRSLIEQVRFQPQDGDYKIFIIDEVHMLSQQAFNAFLKTLEEPPPYAIFILATTEKHKIIPTILSRCQIFDFKRIQVDDIVLQLRKICDEETIEADAEALHVIAAKADGALRDALSIFDKVASFGGKKITYQDVINNLNVLDYDYFFKVVDALLAADLAGILGLFDEVQKLGFDGDVFINGLSEHLRNLLVCKHKSIHHLLNLSEQLNKRYLDQSDKVDENFIIGALDIVNDCDVNYKMSKNKRLHVEMALIKINYLRFVENFTAGKVSKTDQPRSNSNQDKPSVDQSDSSAKKKGNSEDQITVTGRNKIENKTKGVENVKASVGDLSSSEDSLPEARSDYGDPGATGEALPFKIATPSKLENAGIGSLSQFVKAVEKRNIENNELGSAVVSLDQVQSIWNSHADEQTSQTVKAVLQKTNLDVQNNGIVATVASMISKSVILQETTLIERLRSELGLPRLTIRIEIDESVREEISKPKILTAKEKFEILCQQNPYFREFQENFGLRLDQEF